VVALGRADIEFHHQDSATSWRTERPSPRDDSFNHHCDPSRAHTLSRSGLPPKSAIAGSAV
jgi:hypothetical protein